jgi:hypothetical protein
MQLKYPYCSALLMSAVRITFINIININKPIIIANKILLSFFFGISGTGSLLISLIMFQLLIYAHHFFLKIIDGFGQVRLAPFKVLYMQRLIQTHTIKR